MLIYTRLKNKPQTAVISMIFASTGWGLTTLFVASTTSQRVRVSKKATLSKVPRTSALYQPKVSSWEAGRMLILSAIILIMNPIISEAKWAVSVKMAIELAR